MTVPKFTHAQRGAFTRQVALTSLRLLGVLGALYAFLFGLDLMGVAFKVHFRSCAGGVGSVFVRVWGGKVWSSWGGYILS